MTNESCCCCKTNEVGTSKIMCTNCWYWVTEKMSMNDVALVTSMISKREPDNKHAKAICVYLVADNYMQGKARLG